MRVELRLSPDEQRILSNLKLPDLIAAMVSDGDLELDAAEAQALRDLVLDLLPVIGFDAAYQLTAEGKLLDALSDKLFVS